jgi:phytoene dehydrogenase-like protein
MIIRHYDVVILGRNLGALAAAALLARRDVRVLLLGQGQPHPQYRLDRYRFKRDASPLLFNTSPVWRKLLTDLAQTQGFRRKVTALDPMFTVKTATRTLDMVPDVEVFDREIARLFPEVQQLVQELYSRLSLVNSATDATLERDLVWPPGTFWERIEASRAAATLPLAESESAEALLGRFPEHHPFRTVATLPARFATHSSTRAQALAPLPLARLHGAWARGGFALPRGSEELEEFLLERVRAHGGECQLDERATSIVVRRGRVAGVIKAGDEEMTGAEFVLANLTGEGIADLSRGEGIKKDAKRNWPKVTPDVGRFVVSFVVKKKGVPESLPRESFLVSGSGGGVREPDVHLQRYDLDAWDSLEPGGTPPAEPETLLVAESLIPARGSVTLHEARAGVVSVVLSHFPFLRMHLSAIDSPHDGLPVEEYRNGERREIDRIHLSGGSAMPEEMVWQWAIEPRGFLGIGGEPLRGPIPGTFLVGRTVLPALGQEGELLAAWSATRLVSKKNRDREKKRGQMWTKIETG